MAFTPPTYNKTSSFTLTDDTSSPVSSPNRPETPVLVSTYSSWRPTCQRRRSHEASRRKPSTVSAKGQEGVASALWRNDLMTTLLPEIASVRPSPSRSCLVEFPLKGGNQVEERTVDSKAKVYWRRAFGIANSPKVHSEHKLGIENTRFQTHQAASIDPA